MEPNNHPQLQREIFQTFIFGFQPLISILQHVLAFQSIEPNKLQETLFLNYFAQQNVDDVKQQHISLPFLVNIAYVAQKLTWRCIAYWKCSISC